VPIDKKGGLRSILTPPRKYIVGKHQLGGEEKASEEQRGSTSPNDEKPLGGRSRKVSIS